MNSSNFNQTGGYPLKTERLQELQTAYSIFNSLGALAGNFTIISGCVLTGTTVGNGFVYINGELLEFREANGAGNPSVIIIEEPVMSAFKNGIVKQVHTIRYATFGTADESWPWSDFKRPDPIILMMETLKSLEKKSTALELSLGVLEKKNAVFQAAGGMVLWNKPASQIPAGWQEVVNWRGRMPIGLDPLQPEFANLGQPGGAKSKTLSINEMPEHSHEWKYSYERDDNNSGNSYDEFTFKPGSIPVNDSKNPIGKTGGNKAFSIMNPYRTVLFIEFIG
jgi:hypothetical protein